MTKLEAQHTDTTKQVATTLDASRQDTVESDIYDLDYYPSEEELSTSVRKAIDALRENDTTFHQLNLSIPYWDWESITVFWHDNDLHVKDTGWSIWNDYKIQSKNRILNLNQYSLDTKNDSTIIDVETSVDKIVFGRQFHVTDKVIKLNKETLYGILMPLLNNQFSNWILRQKITVKSADWEIDILLINQ